MKHSFWILLISVAFIACAEKKALDHVAQTKRPKPKQVTVSPATLIPAEDCESQTLRITINKNDQSSKEALIGLISALGKNGRKISITTEDRARPALTLIAEFPVAASEPVTTAPSASPTPDPAEPAPEVETELSEQRIGDSDWMSLQREISSLDGVTFSCSETRPSTTPSDSEDSGDTAAVGGSEQDDKKQDMFP